MSKPESQFNSCKLSVPVSEFEALFDPDLWPEGVCVRRFWGKKVELVTIPYNGYLTTYYELQQSGDWLTKVNYVQKLCDDCDIVLLQETWLYEDSNFLDKNFTGIRHHSVSVMDNTVL